MSGNKFSNSLRFDVENLTGTSILALRFDVENLTGTSILVCSKYRSGMC